LTALALAIVGTFTLAAAAIIISVLVHAKRAPRIPNIQEECEQAVTRAREAGFRARQRIKRDAISRHEWPGPRLAGSDSSFLFVGVGVVG
jgi:hypothetical protein